MGNALALRIEEILMAEFDPGWCGSERLHRFDCHTYDEEKPVEYYIHDQGLSYSTKLPTALLLKEHFDLAGWYLKRIIQTRTKHVQALGQPEDMAGWPKLLFNNYERWGRLDL